MLPATYWMVGTIAAGIVLVALVLQLYFERSFFAGGSTSAQRKGLWVANLLGGLWAAAQIAVGWAIRRGDLSEPLQLTVSVAVVALMGVAFVWGIYHWLLRHDELIRRIETEALALGLGLGLVGILAADLLASAGIGLLASDDVDSSVRLAFPMFIGYGIARVYVYNRYK